MSATATNDLPNIAMLTAEQKKQLLAMLVKDELESQPIPMPISVELEGRELGHFRPKWVPPEKATPYPFTEAELKELAKRIRNPGPTFTHEELLALEASGHDAVLLER